MNDNITIPCSDGTDPKCTREIPQDLEYTGLTGDQIEDISFKDGETWIALSPEQMRMNGLTKDHIEYCEKENKGWVHISLDTVCYACGSEQ